MDVSYINGENIEENISPDNGLIACVNDNDVNHLNFSKDDLTISNNENLTESPEENILNNNITLDISKKRKKDDSKIITDDFNVNNRPRRNTPRKSVFEMLQGNEDEAASKKPKKNHIDFNTELDSDKEKNLSKKQLNKIKPETPCFEPQLFEGPILEKKEKRRRTPNEIKTTVEKKKKFEPMKDINLFELESEESSNEERINGSVKIDEDDGKDQNMADSNDSYNKQSWLVKQSQETNDRLRLEELSQINLELRARIAELEGSDRMTVSNELQQNKKFNFDFQSGKFNRVKYHQSNDASEKRIRDGDVASNDKDKRRNESILDARQAKLTALDVELDRRMANVREAEGRITRAERNLRERKDGLDYKEKLLKTSKTQASKDDVSKVIDVSEIEKKMQILDEKEKLLEKREEEIREKESKLENSKWQSFVEAENCAQIESSDDKIACEVKIMDNILPNESN